ncbi:MAG: glycosyltransferase family 2 protein [Chloroflexi bacterium]|nr:glycosyltransferase family 2 protein [Chloroflexota bacterium]MBI3734185.1 glycosyltransferase family 2 protein [Chloroflexota bacterium]
MNRPTPLETVPDITVIIVNYNGRDYLPDCLQSLAEQDYPRERLHILVVDNGSTDASLGWLADHYPQVAVRTLERNHGFAEANNIGAREATTPLIAFLNNDMRVHAHWLSALAAQLQTAPDLAAVGSTILSWDGERIDFAQGVMNYYGMAYQRDAGRPAELYVGAAPREVLFACGGAMLIDRKLFAECGGFDENYFAYFEDVDLGWRLWLMGYRVVTVPAAVAYHRVHGTGGRVPFFQRLVLYERNALRTLFKNADEKHFWRVFSAALLLAFKRQERWLKLGGWPEAEFRFGAAVGDDLTLKANREALALTAAVGDVVDGIVELGALRAKIQASRRRSDEEIFRLFTEPLRTHIIQHTELDEAYAVSHFAVSEATGVTSLFASVPRRILWFADSTDAAGGRPKQIANDLRGLGHEVTLVTSTSTDVPTSPTAEQVTCRETEWSKLLQNVNPDIIGVSVEKRVPPFPRCYQPTVIDWGGAPQIGASDVLGASLRQADFVVFSSEAQRIHYADWLDRAGFNDRNRQTAVIGSTTDQPVVVADGLAQLDYFCRFPRRRVRSAAQGPPLTATQPPSAATAPPVARKSARQLAREAALHYRRGGLRTLTIETLGFIVRQISRG